MRAKRVLDALGDVDGRFLADLRPAPAEPKKRRWPLALTAAAMAALCIFGVSRLNPPVTQDPSVDNPAEQPPADPEQIYPDWLMDEMKSPIAIDINEYYDALFEELTASGLTTNEKLDYYLERSPESVLGYLMRNFLSGGLEGCQWNDGSTALLRFHTWYSMLGGELIPSETETPLQYWQEWTDHARRVYDLNGWEFMADYPISRQYLELRYGDMSRETLDDMYRKLAAVGKTTNETLELLKDELPNVLLDYLMADFMAGGLEGCQLNDGSAGTLKWEMWCSLKGIGDLIENAVETPQGDWLDWSGWAENLLRLNGVDFFDEGSSPATVRYARLLGIS